MDVTTQEQMMVQRGQERARSILQKTLDRGDVGDTPAGRALTKRAVEPLANAITQYIAEAYTGKAGPNQQVAVHLAPLNPEMLAYLTIRSVCSSAHRHFALRSAALALAQQIEEELMGDRFEKGNKVLYDAIIRKGRARGLTPTRLSKAVGLAAKHFEITPTRQWTYNERVHIGAKLVDLLQSVTGIIEVALLWRGRKSVYVVQLSPKVAEWMAEYNEETTLFRPFFLPTVERPVLWSAPTAGAYRSISDFRLVSKPFEGQMKLLAEADLSAVYKGLNGLQDTQWAINTRVLAIMEQAWERGLPLPCMPDRDDIEIPPIPPEVDADEVGGPLRKAWRLKIRRIHEVNIKNRSRRFDLVRVMQTAREYKDTVIYFPHRVDFRGRAYAVSTGLNPQGADESRALLQFAEGQPLGERGLYWLGIHGANLFGNDKVSLEERYQWAQDHAALAFEVVADPLSNQWWTEADKPWSFLAWCFEWASAFNNPDFVSHLPIALDGSCNGIQHFSAMLRDEVGGAAVNLIPSEKPQDIYQRVADRATELLKQESDPEKQWMADAWIRFGIDRKITKRSVMVLPYGGTTQSCRDYVRDAVREKIADGKENPFGDDFQKAVSYLSSTIWAAMSDVVIAARAAMAWLQQCARVATKAGVPLVWTTPSGFVVKQDYREPSNKRIKTHFNGSLVVFSNADPTKNLDKSKQASATSPNFVHSLDASALMLTVGACLDAGIKAFAMIHDSYATHAGNTDQLARILRDQFVAMYLRHDVLQEFMDQLTAQLPPEEAAKLPALPPRGNLDLELVLQSDYFFA